MLNCKKKSQIELVRDRSLTRLQVGVPVKNTRLFLFNDFLVFKVLLGFCELSKETKLSVQLATLHTLLELKQRHALFDLAHIGILKNPLVG